MRYSDGKMPIANAVLHSQHQLEFFVYRYILTLKHDYGFRAYELVNGFLAGNKKKRGVETVHRKAADLHCALADLFAEAETLYLWIVFLHIRNGDLLRQFAFHLLGFQGDKSIEFYVGIVVKALLFQVFVQLHVAIVASERGKAYVNRLLVVIETMCPPVSSGKPVRMSGTRSEQKKKKQKWKELFHTTQRQSFQPHKKLDSSKDAFAAYAHRSAWDNDPYRASHA